MICNRRKKATTITEYQDRTDMIFYLHNDVLDTGSSLAHKYISFDPTFSYYNFNHKLIFYAYIKLSLIFS